MSQCKAAKLHVHVRPHMSSVCMCACACACALVRVHAHARVWKMPKCKPPASDCRPPLERCTWLGDVRARTEQLFSSAIWGGQREIGKNYSCGPGACGNCGLNNVGEEKRQEEGWERSRSEKTQWEMLSLQAETRWDRTAEASWNEKTKEKRGCPSVFQSSGAVKPQRPAGDVDHRFWPQLHSKETWDEKHVHWGLFFNKLIQKHPPQSLSKVL